MVAKFDRRPPPNHTGWFGFTQGCNDCANTKGMGMSFRFEYLYKSNVLYISTVVVIRTAMQRLSTRPYPPNQKNALVQISTLI